MKTLRIFVTSIALIVALIGCSAPPAQYDLTVSATEGGEITTPDEGTSVYDEGTAVPLLALPHAGYRFVKWTGDVDTIDDVEDAGTTITMNDDYSITANFIKQYDLTISSTAGGSVTVPGEATYAYDEGEVVNLVAQAEGGYHFVSWTGDLSTIADPDDATTVITVNGDYIVTANFAVDLYFSADAYVMLNGPATLPVEERTRCILLNIMTNIFVDSVRVDLADGGSAFVPAYTDLNSPEVDQKTLLRFCTCAPGVPIAGGEYIFTGLDAAGAPIAGARNTDIWVGVDPPDPPTNVRAELTGDGILVSWDESAIIPGSFEPAADPPLGQYQLWISRIETGEAVYGAEPICASPHLIPGDKAGFVQGKDLGLSLGEMGDGTYCLNVGLHSWVPEGSCEYNCCDDGQNIIFTIQDGEIAIG